MISWVKFFTPFPSEISKSKKAYLNKGSDTSGIDFIIVADSCIFKATRKKQRKNMSIE